MNPNKYPPLALMIASIPPDAPANQGIPSNPTTRYIIILIPPQYLPKKIPAIKTAKVCNVMGTGVQGNGITTWAMIPVKHATKNAKITLWASEVLERHLNIISLFSK